MMHTNSRPGWFPARFRQHGQVLAATALGLAMAAAAVEACSGGASPTAPTQPTKPTQPTQPTPLDTTALFGNYLLSSVNTKALPVTILSDSLYSLDVMSATVALTAGTQFVIAMTTRETVDGHPSTYVDSASGTWTLHDSTLTLTNKADGTVVTANWDGTHLTLVQKDDTATDSYVYMRSTSARLVAKSP